MIPLIQKNLIEGCRKKDRKSQKELYRLYFGLAMKICLRYSKDKEEALELVNDGFMKIFLNIDRYNENFSFQSWLSTIMINISIDHYRSKIKKISMEELKTTHEPPESEHILSKLNYEELIKLVQRLSVSYRTVFNLFVIDGYSHEEISKMLAISVGASKSNLFKAREHLKKMLRDIEDTNAIKSAKSI
ncbi:RNA polymerase sigma factor [Rubrolithibacter danxiaensis]|uniref:RNA polymerase sigma factor n=1 Tax=Rubrolithibacter danxiaensis TaxID=3390805 RepID=UPI003BF7F28E